jgi:hypothetical protein
VNELKKNVRVEYESNDADIVYLRPFVFCQKIPFFCSISDNRTSAKRICVVVRILIVRILSDDDVSDPCGSTQHLEFGINYLARYGPLKCPCDKKSEPKFQNANVNANADISAEDVHVQFLRAWET